MTILIFNINGMLIYTSDVTYMHDVRLLHPSLVLEGCSSGLVRKRNLKEEKQQLK